MVKRIVADGTNRSLLILSEISKELKVDQSVCHNGVCLTVTQLGDGGHWTTAVNETLEKSNLGSMKEGDAVNLERSMMNNGRFDGHIVQGHVDTTAIVTAVADQNGSWLISFEHAESPASVTVEKGSVCVNGISLTCFNCTARTFSVAIIPYTYHNTNLHQVGVGDQVNLEFDVIGKYVQRLLAATK